MQHVSSSEITYIVISTIVEIDSAENIAHIFDTLEEAQRFVEYQRTIPFITFCDIYEAQKIHNPRA